VENSKVKICSKCKTAYPPTREYFAPDKTARDGLKYQCRICHRKQQKTINDRHRNDPAYKERKREYDRQYRLKPERKNRRRELARNRGKQYRAKSGYREKRRKYNKLNPDLTKTAFSRRQARKRGLPINFSAADWKAALRHFNNRCAVCGRSSGTEVTLAADHWIPLSSPSCPGTVPTNIVPLCHGKNGCNNQKFNRDATEWLVEKAGYRTATQIIARIEEYFASLKA